MKCSKCDNERNGTTAYCTSCYADYVRALRAKKLAKMQQAPIPVPEVIAEEVKESLVIETKSQVNVYMPSPVYWSYYVTKGSDAYKMFKDIEKEMILSQSLSGTP